MINVNEHFLRIESTHLTQSTSDWLVHYRVFSWSLKIALYRNNILAKRECSPLSAVCGFLQVVLLRNIHVFAFPSPENIRGLSWCISLNCKTSAFCKISKRDFMPMIPQLICLPSDNFLSLGMGRETWVCRHSGVSNFIFSESTTDQKIWKFETETRDQWRIHAFVEGEPTPQGHKLII